MNIKLGDRVVDRFNHKGVVVDMFKGHNDKDHGCVAVWQSDRTEYGLDNCEHYPYHNWQDTLTHLK